MSLRKLALIALLTLAPIPSLAQRGNNGVSPASSSGTASVLKAGDGAANAPSITFSSAPTTTGFYKIAAGNKIAWTIAGVAAGNFSDGSFTNMGKALLIDSVVFDVTNADTSVNRAGPGVTRFNVGSTLSGGYLKSAQTLQVNSANFTTSATTLTAVTGLNFTGPTSFASNWSFQCDITYSQATAAAANLWGVITAGTAPTSLHVRATVLTSNANAGINGAAIITTATSTTVATATPSAFGAIGTTADMFQARISGTVEAPSNATPSQIGIAVASGSASDALTIYRGSSCWWY